MSYRGKYRGRGRSGGAEVDTRYSQHDDRSGPVQRDNNRGGSYRGRSSYRGNNSMRGGGGGSRFYSSRGTSYRGSNYRGNRGRRPRGRGPSSYSNRSDRDNSSPFHEDDDGDVNMDGDAESTVRFNPYARPNKSNQMKNRSNFIKKSVKKWYQITVINGSSYDETWLQDQIQQTALIQYQPVQYHLDGNKVSFYLEDYSLAEAIRDCTKKIIAPDGLRVTILMRQSISAPLEDSQVKKLKEVLSSRFEATTQHLDMSALFHEDKLKAEQIEVKVGTAPHMYVVTKIIAENISTLASLDLKSNHLNNFDGLRHLVPFTPYMKKLNLAKNNIKSLKELEKLKEWNLVELTLDENPACGGYKSQTEYISDVREWFPNLEVLDGHKLPAPVKFDVENVELPKSIRDYLPDVGQDIIKQFAQKYFSCYDDDRSMLREAYHTDCVFTISLPSSPRGPPLSKYFQFSRNLKRIKNSSLKTSSVVTSRDDVLSRISKLPLSKHQTDSFCIDVPLVTSSIVNFVVRGLFKEAGRDGYLRAFSRSFFCQVSNNSLKIINEQYFIRNPTSLEIKGSKNTKSTTSPSSSSTTSIPTPAAHTQMIISFSCESGMNEKFSEQCLLENDWNYEKAGKVFLQLREEGKIPPEAFVK